MNAQAQRRIIVPRLMDEGNLNAQVLNAKAMLSRFQNPRGRWFAPYYDNPLPAAQTNPRVRLIRLLRRHLWPFHMVGHYLRPADAIFYANKEWMDDWGLRLRALTGRKVPLIVTLEGIVGDEARERMLSDYVGHPVHCFRCDPKVLATTDQVYHQADHVIAISPFLQRIGRKLYGDKVSALPLGVEKDFTPAAIRSVNERPVIVGAGSVNARKRVPALIELAFLHPQADFKWFGDGPDLPALRALVTNRGIGNFELAGSRPPAELADAFREADIFVQTSWAEGVPKVVQEAAACGLPIVLFGFYEAPSVTHEINGYVAWSDDELIRYVGELIDDPVRRERMGAESARLARGWTWDVVAPEWEARILDIVDQYASAR
jgi:glycosyltransferase involved in cell wall biosynthesis